MNIWREPARQRRKAKTNEPKKMTQEETNNSRNKSVFSKILIGVLREI